jgi:hypothetical protein
MKQAWFYAPTLYIPLFVPITQGMALNVDINGEVFGDVYTTRSRLVQVREHWMAVSASHSATSQTSQAVTSLGTAPHEKSEALKAYIAVAWPPLAAGLRTWRAQPCNDPDPCRAPGRFRADAPLLVVVGVGGCCLRALCSFLRQRRGPFGSCARGTQAAQVRAGGLCSWKLPANVSNHRRPDGLCSLPTPRSCWEVA